MIPAPAVDGRRVESFFQELRRFAPNYTPDLNLSDEQGAGVALMRIFAQLAEIVAVRLDQAPQKHFVAFLDKLGITLLPARAARAAVTFRLAAGLAEEVKVPSGTRVTAPGEEDEIPFETTGELVAIPGVLTAVYGVDPLKDLIFGPPLNFLKQEPRAPTELSYQIQSFVAADSNRLQLNHTTELEPGAFIRIGCKEKRIVQQVEDGNFVTLFEPVKENFTEGTIVVPIRNFEVFNGIDRQEHILYLGHANLFTVKEKVEITLEIELSNSDDAALQPLNLVWEFWTKNEDVTPEEDEHWERLEVKLDGTGGLVSTGRVVLVKPEKLEIKPSKVGGTESRWIRARLEDKLPVGSLTLPEVETIKIGVSTELDANGKPIGIVADQGFYNATPLDVQVEADVGFFPFGTEPRQFDQFYIASEEAFSKREAAVALDFQLELQTLGAPSVIKNDIIGTRVYSLGLRRRLYELDARSGAFNILGNPAENQASSFLPLENVAPSAIANDGGGIFVFVNTRDSQTTDNPANKIWVHFHNFNQNTGTWSDLQAPGAATSTIRLPFSPAAVRSPSNAWGHFSRVFVVASDGKLYSRGHPGSGPWDDHGSPGVPLNSPPFVVAAGSDIFVFANGEGTVHWMRLRSDLTTEWKSLTPNNQVFTPVYRPFAQAYIDGIGDEQARVFTFAFTDPNDKTSGKLFECDTSDENLLTQEFPWNDLGQPNAREITESAPEAHAPNGYLERPTGPANEQGRHIFLRGADNKLYERSDAQWRDQSRSGDPDLRGSPAVFVDPPTGVPAGATTIKSYVFSASGRNSLVKWVFEDLSITVPNISNAERLGVLLDPRRASRRDNDYTNPQQTLEIVSGPGNGEDEEIVAYDGSLALARLDAQLTTLPDDTSEIEIGGLSVGVAQDDSDHILAIHAPVSDNFTARPIYVRTDDGVDNEFVIFEFYSRITGMVSLRPTDFPTSPARFFIHSELRQAGTEFNSPEDTGTVPELSWEYWNGRGWLSLRRISDGTHNLLRNGEVKFDVPKDIEATEVAGQENFWIRARLVGGDYGREVFRLDGSPPNQKIVSEKSTLRPPKVRTLRISYNASPRFPEICLTFNNLDYLDQTAACESPGSHFPPFETLEDESYTIFFGFDKPFKTGPVRLLLDAAERNYDETKPPEFAWSFRKDRKWKSLDAEDGSVALTRQGILTVSAAEELTRESRFGQSLYWIKGSLRLDRALADVEAEVVEPTGPCGEPRKEPEDPCAELKSTDPKEKRECACSNKCSCESTAPEDPCAQLKDAKTSKAAAASADYPLPLLRGIFLNTIWATQGETITEEIVGSGDGEPNQTHALQKADVLQGEDIRVQEALSAEERERIERELGKDSVVDREDLGGTWVRWKEVKALFDSGPHDRSYEIDRAAGLLRFGDGVHGSLVPAGVDNIRAFSYRTGGGSLGNVDTNQIQGLATAVAGIESVFNPAPAGGGSDKADTNAMLTIGPRRISHGDRAVSVEDFEELAHEASRQVAKVRCLGTTNLVRAGAGLPDPCDPRQHHQALTERGRVSLVIVPDSPDPRPCPSLELRRAVKDYLSERAPSAIAAPDRIVVRPPDYVIVSIEASIFVNTLEKAAAVETEARTTLENFLHPVRGGPEGTGWEFGRPVTRSDIFALLERLPDVDRVEDLVFQFGSRRDANRVEIGPNELIASGEHKLAIKKA